MKSSRRRVRQRCPTERHDVKRPSNPPDSGFPRPSLVRALVQPTRLVPDRLPGSNLSLMWTPCPELPVDRRAIAAKRRGLRAAFLLDRLVTLILAGVLGFDPLPIEDRSVADVDAVGLHAQRLAGGRCQFRP